MRRAGLARAARVLAPRRGNSGLGHPLPGSRPVTGPVRLGRGACAVMYSARAFQPLHDRHAAARALSVFAVFDIQMAVWVRAPLAGRVGPFAAKVAVPLLRRGIGLPHPLDLRQRGIIFTCGMLDSKPTSGASRRKPEAVIEPSGNANSAAKSRRNGVSGPTSSREGSLGRSHRSALRQTPGGAAGLRQGAECIERRQGPPYRLTAIQVG